MAFLFSANSMAMVAPNLTCAASYTHTRRALHARAASGPSRHQTAHRCHGLACRHTTLTASRRRA
eukprot:scaffold45105_cov67-Phaeocystis_antarctica.AAC.2